ncbi:hypothetical protein [Mesorhizobium captivum]|uniref:hypothetical protein n=1 Tax=Mesorhizobium captivum TaxID=3072319 RepID=UPI002A24077A|nr:hypothetical protein [Mesorhizobium sp. VK3C]MDX8450041.1 hypothetical protein [Mesorhizobium sp. VK3C]
MPHLNLTRLDHSTKPTPNCRPARWGPQSDASAHCSGWSTSALAVFGEGRAPRLFFEACGDEFLLETVFEIWFGGLHHEDTMNEPDVAVIRLPTGPRYSIIRES